MSDSADEVKEKKEKPVKKLNYINGVDSRGNRYLTINGGQLIRQSENGGVIPRIRMSKKQRRKLRKEYKAIKEMDQKALANKILNTPVIIPPIVEKMNA